MKKSTLIMIVSLVLAIALGLGTTMAYLQDTDEDVNVMTLGSVYITQNEQEYNEAGELVEFTQDKPLYPAVGTPAWNLTDESTEADKAWRQFAGMENVVDKYVTVTNTGKSDAYVRTLVALEMGDLSFQDLANVLGISTNDVDGAEFDFPGAWDCVEDEVYAIGGKNYNVMVFEHQNAVKPGETTIPSLLQLYLKGETTTNDTLDMIDGNGNGKYDVLVLSQAVQTMGFADANTALTTAFGEINAENVDKWFANIGENIGTPGDKWPNNNPPSAFTGNAAELANLLTNSTDAASGNTTIELDESYDMTGYDWTPITVDGYHGAGVITIKGNGNYIKGLNAPLFKGGFAGKSGIVIEDLTIMASDIVSTNTLGSGAFIESVDSMQQITLDNCHLLNSTVTGGSGSRTGGLIGWTAGYNNVNDGPVKTYVDIRNCSVIDCEITCDGSVGGIYGHAGNNAWTYSTIENCTVKNCKLNSTDNGGWRVGVVVGTANVGEVTINNITESGNTLTQTGKTAPEAQSNLYGRAVLGETGKLVIDGVEIQ